MISLTRVHNRYIYHAFAIHGLFAVEENEIKRDSQIQLIFFFFGSKLFFAWLHVRVSTRSRIRSSCAFLTPSNNYHQSSLLSEGSSTVLSDDNDDGDDGDDDENDERARRRGCPTVADVRKRARQSTCHATPGSFELIAGTSLASTSSCPIIAGSADFITLHLLVRFSPSSSPPPPSSHRLAALLLIPSC